MHRFEDHGSEGMQQSNKCIIQTIDEFDYQLSDNQSEIGQGIRRLDCNLQPTSTLAMNNNMIHHDSQQ